MKKNKFIGLFVALMIMLTGCASYHPDVNERGVEVNGYIVIKSSKHLVKCHAPGSAGYGGIGNDIYNYPSGQNTYSFTGTSSTSELNPVAVVSSDGQTLHVPGFVKFHFTTNCADLYEFHKRVGARYKVYTDAGLRAFENDYFKTAVTSALNDESGSVGWRALYQDPSQRTKIESNLVPELNKRLGESVGSNDWFHVDSVSLSKPEVSSVLVKGLEASQAADLKNKAQRQVNKLNRTKYQSFADCQKVTTPQNCLTLKLAEDGKINFYPVPQGSNVNVTPK